MTLTLLLVAAGGAIGASLRYAFGIWMGRVIGAPDMPVAILSVNVLGSFLMGLCAAMAVQKGLGPWQPFLMVGLLGGFTTFSAFSLETMTLIERGDLGLATVYVGLSVILSVGGLACGLWLGRAVLA